MAGIYTIIAEGLVFLTQLFVNLFLLGILIAVGAVFFRWITSDEPSPWNQASMAVAGGVLGSIAFALLNPIVSPMITDAQQAVGIGPQPKVSLEVMNESLTQSNQVLYADYQPDRTLYRVNIRNFGKKEISDVIIRFGFNGCGIASGFAPVPQSDPIMEDVNQVSIRDDRPADEVERCYEDIRIEELSAGEEVGLYFVADQDPEANATLGETAHLKSGSVYASYQFEWRFQGREYSREDYVVVAKGAEKILS